MRARNGERGTTLVETAIVMGVLLMFTLGIFDFGRALYTYSFLANAARQGARWAIVRGADCTQLDHCPAKSGSTDIQPFVQSLSEGATKASNIQATLNFPNGNDSPGSIAQVTVTYPFTFIAPGLSKLSFTMTSTSEMIISN